MGLIHNIKLFKKTTQIIIIYSYCLQIYNYKKINLKNLVHFRISCLGKKCARCSYFPLLLQCLCLFSSLFCYNIINAGHDRHCSEEKSNFEPVPPFNQLNSEVSVS